MFSVFCTYIWMDTNTFMYTYVSRTVLESTIKHILFPGQTWNPTNVLEYTITYLEMAWYLPFDKDIYIYEVNLYKPM